MFRELQFRILARRYADEIYRYARSLLREPSDAEDATQEVLIRLWDNLATVPLFKARGWLYRTTQNYCLDQIRRRNHRAYPTPTDTVLLGDEPDSSHSPEDNADLQSLRVVLDRAIANLQEPHRSVFVLYEINGLKYRQIADALDLPLNTVKVHLSRARRTLQSQLKEHESWIHA